MEPDSKRKWEGEVSTRLYEASANQIWPLFKDFFHISKWFPGLSTSYGIHGSNGVVGAVRYCAGSSFHPPGAAVGWSNERLVKLDPHERIMAYQILENNIGFKSYVAAFKVVPLGRHGDEKGCVIYWSFRTAPMKGTTLKDMLHNYEIWLGMMAEKMEKAVVHHRD